MNFSDKLIISILFFMILAISAVLVFASPEVFSEIQANRAGQSVSIPTSVTVVQSEKP